MGQSSSNNNNNSNNALRPTHNPRSKSIQSPAPASSSPSSSRSPTKGDTAGGQPHRSLRTKKKSLELPDLASLGLSAPGPSTYSSTRRASQQHQSQASPIPIPIPTKHTSPQTYLPNPFARSTKGGGVRSDEGGPRQYDGAGDEEPSTHIPIYPDAGERGGGGRRGNRFIRGAPLQYNSTYSFGPGGGSSTHAAHRTAPPLPPTPTTATQPTRSTS